MNIRWYISQSEAGKFMNTCEAVIRNVGAGTKAATEIACAEIMADSLAQVPKDTGTLASTGDYIVRRRGDIKNAYRYEGIVGYAGFSTTGVSGNSIKRCGYKYVSGERSPVGAVMSGYARNMDGSVSARDAINPKNGLPASAYAAVVHEDLDMPHPRGGKAKFLEDPVREYGQANFKRVAETYWRWSINWVNGIGRNRFGKEAEITFPVYSRVKLTPTQAAPHGDRGGRTLL